MASQTIKVVFSNTKTYIVKTTYNILTKFWGRVMTEEVVPQKNKRIVERSIKYPYYDLNECLNFVEKIKNIGGRKEAPIPSILKEMNVKDVSNKRYSYSVSSAEQFGLIEKTENGLKVTDRVMVILFPTEGESQRNAALKDCFKRPNLYTIIISQFDGLDLPGGEILRNTFLHYGIAENVVDQAVRSFIESAKYASVLKNNKLCVTVTEDNKPPQQKNKDTDSTDQLPKNDPSEYLPTDINGYNKVELSISSGKKVTVIIPTDCKKEDIDKLKRLLDVFAPDT